MPGKEFIIIGGGKSLIENKEAFERYTFKKKPNIIYSSVNTFHCLSEFNKNNSCSVLCLLGDDYNNLNLASSVNVSSVIYDDLNKDLAKTFDCNTISSQLINLGNGIMCSSSPLSLSLLYAKSCGASSVKLFGFDGYQEYSRASKVLAEEAQNAINNFTDHINITTLTSSLYMNLRFTSIYSFLED